MTEETGSAIDSNGALLCEETSRHYNRAWAGQDLHVTWSGRMEPNHQVFQTSHMQPEYHYYQ
jgi:hypothetical protein